MPKTDWVRKVLLSSQGIEKRTRQRVPRPRGSFPPGGRGYFRQPSRALPSSTRYRDAAPSISRKNRQPRRRRLSRM